MFQEAVGAQRAIYYNVGADGDADIWTDRRTDK